MVEVVAKIKSLERFMNYWRRNCVPGMLVRVYEFLEGHLHAGYVSTVSELQEGKLFAGDGRIMNCWRKNCKQGMLVQTYELAEGHSCCVCLEGL